MLAVHEVDVPAPNPGQIRVAVKAAGVNPFDWRVRSGQLRDVVPVSMPSGTGTDAAGTVDKVGSGVTGVAVGDLVFGNGSGGTYAGLATPAEAAFRILQEVDVHPGQTLLVSGASGAVGSMVIQLAHSREIAVIGTASPDNADYLRSLGAVAVPYGPGARAARLCPLPSRRGRRR